MSVYDFYMLHQRGQLGEDPRCSVADVRGQYQWWVMSETHVLLRYWSSWSGWACKIGDGHRSGAYVRNNIMLILTTDVAFFDSSLQHYPPEVLEWTLTMILFNFRFHSFSFYVSFSIDGDLTVWSRSSPNWKKNNPLGNCYWQLPTPGAGGPQFWWLPKIYRDPSSSNPYTPSPRSNLSF